MKKLLSLLVLFVATMSQPLPIHADELSYDGGPLTEATQRSGKVLDMIIKVNNYWQ